MAFYYSARIWFHSTKYFILKPSGDITRFPMKNHANL